MRAGLVLLALVAASCAKSMPSVHVKQGAASQGVSLQVITMSEKNQPTWMLVNSSTGELSCAGTMVFPTTDTGCSWSLGTGRRGESSTMFYANRSWMFLGQEICNNQIKRTQVLFSRSFCGSGQQPGFILISEVTPDFGPSNGPFHIAWDHTCNVVVIGPSSNSTGDQQVPLHTLQVSEYDGQRRIRPTFETVDVGCTDCWVPVGGLGGLDHKGDNDPWNPELNCGDECLFYTLHEQRVAGVAQKPRSLWGRSFRTGTLATQVADSVQALTLEYVEYWNLFLGIGVCCSDSWCHPKCAGLEGQFVIFTFTPASSSGGAGVFDVIAPIGPAPNDMKDCEESPTARLGVELDALYQPTRLFAFYENSVLTYEVARKGTVLVAKQTGSASVTPALQAVVAWAQYPEF